MRASELDVWPLYFRHVLASVGGLITGGLGRRWKLTPLGERFLAAPSPLQVWLLLMTWWMQTNWAIAFPYDFGDDDMPIGFSNLILKNLRELPTTELVPFEAFAKRMIEEARFQLITTNPKNGQLILNSLIERVVINPLADFGILQKEYLQHVLLGEEFQQLSRFQVTPFGKGLLEAINAAIEP